MKIQFIKMVLLSSLILSSCNKEAKLQEQSNITSTIQYKLIEITDSIKIGDKKATFKPFKIYNYKELCSLNTLCSKTIFTDSILSLWDKATYENIALKYEKSEDENLIQKYFSFKTGDIPRLAFAKLLNDSDFIQNYNIDNGFYIIETSPGALSNGVRKMLIKKSSNEQFECTFYLFVGIHLTWRKVMPSRSLKNPSKVLKNHVQINKLKFEKWFDEVKTINAFKGVKSNYEKSSFIVTEFSKNGISSYFFDFAPYKLYHDLEEMINVDW